MKRIAVTGCDGFIGKNLCMKIERMGHELIPIDSEYMSYDKWTDIIKRQLGAADFVFHVGAIADTLEQDVNKMMLYNYQCTKVIAEFCKENNTPLVYSSSAACYGNGNGIPENLYAWSKYLGELEVLRNDGIALRYFNVFGFNEGNKGKMASMAYHGMRAMMKGEKIRLYYGKPRRDFIYIDDVVSANLYAMQNYDLINHIAYDVGTGKASTFEELMRAVGVEHYYGAHDDGFEPQPGYQWHTCADKAKWMMGWWPEYGLVGGMDKYKKQMQL